MVRLRLSLFGNTNRGTRVVTAASLLVGSSSKAILFSPNTEDKSDLSMEVQENKEMATIQKARTSTALLFFIIHIYLNE